MSFVSALFGSRTRIAVVALLFVGGAVGGAYATGIIGAPSVENVENQFAGVNDTQTVIETDIVVNNPNPISANLSGLSVDYTVTMNDIEMANGAKEGVALDSGNATIPLRTTLDNERIPKWWVSHIQNGEHTSLGVDATVNSSTLGRSFEAPEISRSIDTDLLSAFNSTETREVNADSAVISDPVLYINETSAEWGNTTSERTELELTFVVHNPKSYPVAISELGYNISMNDVKVGNGTTGESYVIPAHTTKTITATTHIENENLDEWWVTHLERNQQTDLRIDFYAKIDAAGTTLRIPLDALTYEKSFETDIFGNKAATGGPSDTSSSDTETTASDTTTTSESGDSTEATTSADETTESSTTTTATTATTTTTESTTTTATTTTTTTTTTTESPTTTDDDDGLL
ncbi:LEA type 2 family protein [Haloferax namakaokahaiae]|uniref:LEA type 2 family protein n=1 Tax=Haloferax namakaokahaiae TaxID=1748331 RepID=A0ABD5ZFE6_9EURY